MKNKKIRKLSYLIFIFPIFLSSCQGWKKVPYKPTVPNYNYETKYKDNNNYLNSISYEDNDNLYYYNSEPQEEIINEYANPVDEKNIQPSSGTTEEDEYIYPYSDNDDEYYPIITNDNKDSGKGIYEPFATDNLIPYEDNDDDYYPMVYDY